MFKDNHVIPYFRNVLPEMEKHFRTFEEKYSNLNDETRKIVYLALCYYVQTIDDRESYGGYHIAPKVGILSRTSNIFTTGVSLKRTTDEWMTFGF